MPIKDSVNTWIQLISFSKINVPREELKLNTDKNWSKSIKMDKLLSLKMFKLKKEPLNLTTIYIH